MSKSKEKSLNLRALVMLKQEIKKEIESYEESIRMHIVRKGKLQDLIDHDYYAEDPIRLNSAKATMISDQSWIEKYGKEKEVQEEDYEIVSNMIKELLD